MRRVLSLLAIAVAIATMAGCHQADSAAPAETSAPDIGLPCATNDGCTRGLCVRVDGAGGVCTRTCEGDEQCPSGANWACREPEGLGANVCACRKLADHEVCGNGLDDECNGLVDDCLDCDGTVVRADDPAHCGGCGRACRADQACVRGACACPTGEVACGDRCVDLQTDATSCGACGLACPSGETCRGGACSCSDPARPDWCGVVGCVDFATDAAHCGACGHACPTGASCVAGACACADGQLVCGGACVDAGRDAKNCGACGVACGPGEHCSSGSCLCDAGRQHCGDACVSLSTDAANCGACGHGCGVNEACTLGGCVCPGQLRCNGACVPPDDPANCGACGNECGAGQLCSSGKCTCSGGEQACATSCVDAANDAQNCGACGHACGAGQVCVKGACACPTSGQSYCAGAGCVSLAIDDLNCGACGSRCPDSTLCISGQCACPTSGQTYCAAMGACRDLRTDPGSCGACGASCAPGQICTAGACACAGTLRAWCASAGACIDVGSDASNCGACGVVCPAGTRCAAGTCACDAAGSSLCGELCVDLSSDLAHCGSCANACAAGAPCFAGSCKCPSPTLGAQLALTSTSSGTPSIAGAGTQLVATWLQLGSLSVVVAPLGADGTRVGTEVVLSHATSSADAVATDPDIAWSGSEFLVVWPQKRAAGGHDVYAQRLSASGAVVGARVSLGALAGTTGSALTTGGAVHVAWAADHWVLASSTGSAGGVAVVVVQTLAADASSAGPTRTVSIAGGTAYTGPTAIAGAPDGGAAVAARAGVGTVSIVEVQADGTLGAPSVLDAAADYGTSVDVEWDGRAWLTAWRTYASQTSRVVVARGTASPTRVSLDAASGSASASPFGPVRIVRRGGTATIAFGRLATAGGTSSDVRLARVGIPGDATSPPAVILDPRVIEASRYVPPGARVDVADPDGSPVVVWPDVRSGPPLLRTVKVDTKGCP